MAESPSQFALRPCAPGSPGIEHELALVGAASFLEAFAGMLDGEDILAHCRIHHSPEKYAALLADPQTRACIAEVKNAPVGYAMLCAPDLPVAAAPGDLELKRIYLLYRFQGTGIGAALMNWAIDTARSLGCQRLLLGVHEGNARALSFYKRHGFEAAGKRTFQVGSTLCNDLILARELRA